MDDRNWLRTIHRSQTDRWIGGVCGGLGEMTPIPSWLWRLLFTLLVLCYGVGILPYVLLWIFVPKEGAGSGAGTAPPGGSAGGFTSRSILWVLPALLLLIPGMRGGAEAAPTYQTMVCQNKVVTAGDTKAEVLMKCGEPLFQSADEVADMKRVERWIYKIDGFNRVFVFEGGVLQRIEAGSLAD